MYQLARPGYLFGVTEYDDGVLFGNALRLAAGVIPYRDFSMVQPPGSMLLMVPAALLAKVAGTAWGLAVARMLTVGADTANVVLLGVLVRNRGPLTVGIACGLYAVYPDAITAAHTFLLEPWLTMFCLAGAVLIFDGDRIAGTAPRHHRGAEGAPRVTDTARLAWGGVMFGFAMAVKIWALVPLAIAGLLVVVIARQARPAAALAGGAALGVGIPLLPFAVLAPGALARGVLVGQVVRNAGGSRHFLGRLADMAGLQLLPARLPQLALLLVVAVIVGGCYVAAFLAAGWRLTALDAYALLGSVAVTALFLWPRLYYSHYSAFGGPFLALAIALPIGRLTARRVVGRAPGNPAGPAALQAAVAAVMVVVIMVAGILQFRAESRLRGIQVSARADRLIPAGACVVTNDPAFTVAADRFYSDVQGCPAIVDSFGTLFAMTSGQSRDAPAAVLRPVVDLWQTALERARYVWFTSDTIAQIPWNRPLYDYFHSHFRLIRFAGQPVPWHDVPRPGLYVRV
jgi:alpha-1,2-mannosyltransferase